MLGCLWGGIRFLSGIDIFSRNIPYYVAYPEISGIQTATPVTIQGVKVGTVTAIGFDPSVSRDVVLQLTVRRSFRIPRDSKARIYSDGFMGGKAIAIEMGDSPQLLSKGDTLVAAETQRHAGGGRNRTGRREGASDAGDGQPVGHARKRQRRAERQQGKYRRDADAPELDFGQYGRRAGGRKGQFADGDRQHRQVFDRAGRELRALLVDDRQSGPVLAAADRGRHRLAVARSAHDAGRIESDRGPHQRGERHGGPIDERSAALRVVGDGERQSGGVARRFEGSPPNGMFISRSSVARTRARR